MSLTEFGLSCAVTRKVYAACFKFYTNRKIMCMVHLYHVILHHPRVRGGGIMSREVATEEQVLHKFQDSVLHRTGHNDTEFRLILERPADMKFGLPAL